MTAENEMSTSTATHRVARTGTVTVPRDPHDALALFTAEGERHWAPDWDPSYPDSNTVDATAPGTIWRTERDEIPVTWVVADRRPAGFTYALVIGNIAAGTVTIDCAPDSDGATITTVTYDLTALSLAGLPLVAEVADTFTQRMRTWTDLLAKVPSDLPVDVTVPRGEAGRTARGLSSGGRPRGALQRGGCHAGWVGPSASVWNWARRAGSAKVPLASTRTLARAVPGPA